MNIVVLPVSAWRRIDLVLHVAADQRVERAERLVVEHHVRVHREGARDADALLHPAGELVGELVRDVLEPDELQHLARPRVPLGLRHSLHLEPERDVVEHAPVGEQAEVLEDHRDLVAPELAELGLARGHDVRARRSRSTPAVGSIRRISVRTSVDLPGAGQAHDDEHLAGTDLERDVAHRRDAARLLAQLPPRRGRRPACR